MYGTVAHFRLHPGMESELRVFAQYESNLGIPGYIGVMLYRSDADPLAFTMAVVFADRESYEHNAASPEQHERYLRFRALLEADPEWRDGEIIFSDIA